MAPTRGVRETTWLDGPWYWLAVGLSISLLLLVAGMVCVAHGTTLPLALLQGFVLVAQVAASDAGVVLFWGAVLVGVGVARLRRRRAA